MRGANGYAKERCSSDPKFESQWKNFFYEIKVIRYTNRCMINVILIYIHPQFL